MAKMQFVFTRKADDGKQYGLGITRRFFVTVVTVTR